MAYQNVDLAGDILQVGSISIDPAGAANVSTTKALTAVVSSGALTTASVTTTKLAGNVTLGGAANTMGVSAGSVFTLTIVNSSVADTDQCFASVAASGSTGGPPLISTVAPSAGALVIKLTPSLTGFSAGGYTVSYIVLKN